MAQGLLRRLETRLEGSRRALVVHFLSGGIAPGLRSLTGHATTRAIVSIGSLGVGVVRGWIHRGMAKGAESYPGEGIRGQWGLGSLRNAIPCISGEPFMQNRRGGYPERWERSTRSRTTSSTNAAESVEGSQIQPKTQWNAQAIIFSRPLRDLGRSVRNHTCRDSVRTFSSLVML